MTNIVARIVPPPPQDVKAVFEFPGGKSFSMCFYGGDGAYEMLGELVRIVNRYPKLIEALESIDASRTEYRAASIAHCALMQAKHD